MESAIRHCLRTDHRITQHLYRALMTLVILFAMAGSARGAIEYADVTGGRLRGEVGSELASFKGVPFAAPPVGALRWKAPQPVVGWSGTRNANTFAPACVQPWSGDLSRISEDCLYLNVWTAAMSSKERRPVMVWIHGGGLTNGMCEDTCGNRNRVSECK